MLDLNSNAALTRKFLTYLAFAPVLTRLIIEADKTAASGHEKRDRVLDAVGTFVGALAGGGYMPPDIWNDSTRNEIGKLNDALVSDMRRSGELAEKRSSADPDPRYPPARFPYESDVPRFPYESDAEYKQRIDEELQRRKQQ